MHIYRITQIFTQKQITNLHNNTDIYTITKTNLNNINDIYTITKTNLHNNTDIHTITQIFAQ